jgi:hypothetical protein
MFSELHVEQIRECGRREFPILRFYSNSTASQQHTHNNKHVTSGNVNMENPKLALSRTAAGRSSRTKREGLH